MDHYSLLSDFITDTYLNFTKSHQNRLQYNLLNYPKILCFQRYSGNLDPYVYVARLNDMLFMTLGKTVKICSSG